MKIFSAGFENKRVLPRKRKIAPNANNITQLKYKSTKKRRTCSSIILSKPTLQQMIESKKELLKKPVKLCGICLKEDDHLWGTPVVNWIECSKCKMWIHVTCCKGNKTCSFCNQ